MQKSRESPRKQKTYFFDLFRHYGIFHETKSTTEKMHLF